jgi:radical SAM superfamily enzyme YgiQ (UPF0313 family)
MYTDPQKAFSIKKESEVIDEIKSSGESFGSEVKRIFLADGDAMVLPSQQLLTYLNVIQESFPSVNRVGAYGLPRNMIAKSDEELKELQEAGLKIVYVGAESGDDTVLKKIHKGESQASTIKGLLKLKNAGIKASVMILNGMGGKVYSKQHALNTAVLVNETQPELLASLVVSFPKGEGRLRERFPEFEMLSPNDLLAEMRTFIKATELARTIFRSNHASNYFELKGTLGKSKDQLLDQIDLALAEPDGANFKPEWLRGL